MANRNFPQSRVWGFHLLPTRLDLSVPIGSSGAVGTISGLGIASVTRLGVGTYRIQLQDNYASFMSLNARCQAPVTGSNVMASALVADTIYQITALGTTTQALWVAAGVPSGITAAPGVVFKAIGASAGNGTAKALGNSGIQAIEILGSPSAMLSNQPFNAGSGGYITIQCLGATDSATTTLIPTDPASGSTLWIDLYVNSSNVQ